MTNIDGQEVSIYSDPYELQTSRQKLYYLKALQSLAQNQETFEFDFSISEQDAEKQLKTELILSELITNSSQTGIFV